MYSNGTLALLKEYNDFSCFSCLIESHKEYIRKMKELSLSPFLFRTFMFIIPLASILFLTIYHYSDLVHNFIDSVFKFNDLHKWLKELLVTDAPDCKNLKEFISLDHFDRVLFYILIILITVIGQLLGAFLLGLKLKARMKIKFPHMHPFIDHYSHVRLWESFLILEEKAKTLVIYDIGQPIVHQNFCAFGAIFSFIFKMLFIPVFALIVFSITPSPMHVLALMLIIGLLFVTSLFWLGHVPPLTSRGRQEEFRVVHYLIARHHDLT